MGCKGQFARTFSNLPEKLLCSKLSAYNFAVAVVTFYFLLPYCHSLRNRKFDTWNLVLIKQLKKSTLGCARTWSEASWLSTLSICLTVLRLDVPLTFKLLLSARNLTPNWGHICNMQQTVWQKVFIKAVYFKLKTQLSVLAWTLLIWSRCPGTLQHTPFPQSTITKERIWNASFAQTFKWVSCTLTLTYWKTKLLETVCWFYVYSLGFLWHKNLLFMHSITKK